MRRLVMLLFFMLLTAPSYAQRLNLDFPSLADRATESVDVTLDGAMLRLAGKFLSVDDPDERKAREIISQLQGIYVRSYTFGEDNAYDRDIVERVRKQLGPSWKKLVSVQSRLKENVDIYVDMRGDAAAGLVIISAEPRELTLVNLVGPIDLDRLAALEGEFGIPHFSKGKSHD